MINIKNLTTDMFKSRAEHGDIRVGDLSKWPDRPFDTEYNHLGGPFVVTSVSETNWSQKHSNPNLNLGLGNDTYPLVDTYLRWYRPKKNIVVVINEKGR